MITGHYLDQLVRLDERFRARVRVTTGLSVAHGSVTLLNPLTPGTHTIVIIGGLVPTVTTTIFDKPGLIVLQRNPTVTVRRRVTPTR